MPTGESPVAAAVRAEVARAGISGRELARELGWTQTMLSRRLIGQIQFRADELAAIASHLGIPATRFMEHLPTEAAS